MNSTWNYVSALKERIAELEAQIAELEAENRALTSQCVLQADTSSRMIFDLIMCGALSSPRKEPSMPTLVHDIESEPLLRKELAASLLSLAACIDRAKTPDDLEELAFALAMLRDCLSDLFTGDTRPTGTVLDPQKISEWPGRETADAFRDLAYAFGDDARSLESFQGAILFLRSGLAALLIPDPLERASA